LWNVFQAVYVAQEEYSAIGVFGIVEYTHGRRSQNITFIIYSIVIPVKKIIRIKRTKDDYIWII